MVISRRIYRFEQKPDYNLFANNNDVLRCVVAKYKEKYYMYIETKDDNSKILDVLKDEERLFEIFHFCPALEADEWIKGRNNSNPVLCFNTLKPDKISSYIFYHYAFQEEMRGPRRKYYSIFISGCLLINFYETPVVMCDPGKPGLLNSSISQMENWNEYMKSHFPPNPKWDNGEIIFDYSITN